MGKTFRKRQKPGVSLIFSAIIFCTIPLAVYFLITTENLDHRQLAIEEQSPCVITIPYVNSKTLEIDKSYKVHVYTNIQNQKITSLNIFNKSHQSLFTKEYGSSLSNISETFTYTPTKLGSEEIFGEIKTEAKRYPCKMDKTQQTILVVHSNTSPQVLTDPYFSALPPSNSLRVQDSYEYVLEVSDKDKDRIEYHYSFTPRANWLHKTVLESGEDGKLKIKFAGKPDKEGSYLANVFIHDGYNTHISAQSWIINIGEEKSDQPVRQEPLLPNLENGITNQIILNEPQINKMLPSENSNVFNSNQIISANLIASEGAAIKKDSIVLKLNEAEVTNTSEIIEISEKEVLLRHNPLLKLKSGEYRVYIYFKDTNNLETSKEWTFTLETDEDSGTFMGIPINTILIFVMGFLLLLFALSIPWILYIAWKKDEPEDYEEIPIKNLK